MTDLIGPASAPNSTTTRPLLYRVFGAIDTWFKPCSNPASQDGTQLQADFFNGLLGQMRGLIRGNGNLLNGAGPVVPEVNTSDAMMLSAVQLLIARGQPNCGTDTGTADALAVGPATPWPEYKAGARIWVIKSTAAGPNATAAPTLAVSGLPPVPIVRRDGSALLPGDLPAGVLFCAEFDGAYFRLVSLSWGEIAAAVQSGKWVYGAATVSGNAASVTLFPSQPAVDGQEILVKWPAPNVAAAPTLNVAGVGTRTVVKQGGGTVQPLDLAGYVPVIYDATLGAWRVNGTVASDFAPIGRSAVYIGTNVTTQYTFVVPAGVTQLEVWLVAAGGGGGASADGSGGSLAGNMGGGGWGGTFGYRRLTGLTPLSTITVTIGAYGVGVNNGSGTAGATSSFGPYLTCTGGSGGLWGANTYGNSGTAGSVSGLVVANGDWGVVGGAGGNTYRNTTTPSTSDAISVYGRGGSAAGGFGFVDLCLTGTAGRGYGPGGTGASGGSGAAGGNGAPAFCLVRW